MRPPEMSYTPVYKQAQDPLGAVPASILAPRPRHSSGSPDMSLPDTQHTSDEWTPGFDVSPRSSSPQGSHAYSPEASRRQSRVDDSSQVSRILVSRSGAAHKEERGSWADQPSLMSAEQLSSSRAQKRGVPDDNPVDKGQDALLMLFRLSVPVPIFSFTACLYTCCALIFAVFSSPLRICSLSPYLRNTSFVAQVCDLLSPTLLIHERLVCMRPPTSDRSSSTQWIRSETHSDQPSMLAEPTRYYRVSTSIGVLILSPFLSIVILLFAWTAAFFWVFSKVMGNPDGTERKDDGRTAVLGVCKWWRTWLGKARKS
ncbi:uncharacterized protein N7477_008865 [Penicillium maclennaniae]|uniref:uncharacterized protein n=1 Tax=Penicillium maclennaniae TaxID=1343394 RepID=UPI0025410F7E|nr:uncharacterized protein N7477_008865 [Penicillium maclennaniae]KAJ5666417.1 hypothetical protein N7477_008865 [Penicillium maclennaniae]